MAKIAKVELTYEDFENIIVTALEVGSNYWYLIKEGIPPRTDPDVPEPKSVRIAKKAWADPDWELPIYDLEAHNPFSDSTDKDEELLGKFSRRKLEAHITDADWALQELLNDNLDATSADALFQLGTMGEIIFG